MNLNALSKSLFCIVLFALFSCKKSKNEQPAHDIYIVGNDNGQPVYWKNGTKTALTTSYSSGKFSSGYATGITFSGDDMYICGMAGTNHSTTVAVYWKNGVLDTLKRSSGLETDAYSIAISGKDIYVGGGYNGFLLQNSGSKNALLWKNGIPTEFGGSVAHINDLFATSNDLYSAGFDGDSFAQPHATYYKNGSVVKLNDTAGFASTGIYVSGNDVYVSGDKSVGFDPYAVYWKNGIKISLSTQISDSNAIYVSGTDVYVAGWETVNGKTIATIWKNGVAMHLSSSSSDCTDVSVSGNNVYVIGEVFGSPGTPAAITWKNGIATTLTSTEHFAGKIYIK
jgi:hypothetical protein